MVCGKCNGEKCKKRYLCPCSFGLALGIVSGLCLALHAWVAWFWGIGAELIAEYGAIYYGYAPTFIGGVWGAIWGLIGGFIFGFILVLCYNLILCCCKGKKDDNDRHLAE